MGYYDPDSTSIKYVSGDVTHPQAMTEGGLMVQGIGTRNGAGQGLCLSPYGANNREDESKS